MYIDGFLAPVAAGTSAEAYRIFAAKAAPIFKDHGATRVVEGWGDDVPHGTLTDFYRAVAATEGETVVFFVDRMAGQGNARRRHEEGDGRPAHAARRGSDAVRRQKIDLRRIRLPARRLSSL